MSVHLILFAVKNKHLFISNKEIRTLRKPGTAQIYIYQLLI